MLGLGFIDILFLALELKYEEVDQAVQVGQNINWENHENGDISLKSLHQKTYARLMSVGA